MVPEEPPADPEAWSDEQWLEWLRATDAAADDDEAGDPDDRPVTATGRFAGTAVGQVLGAAMLGLNNAIYGKKDDEVAIVVDADGEPHDPEGVEVHLDEEHPDESVVVVRPWLLAPPPNEPPDEPPAG